MEILGIIGRSDVSECHDAAAAIIKDGKIIAAIEQERLSRKKHAPGEAPVAAVMTCLKQARLLLDDIDYIAYGWLEPLSNPFDKLGDDIIASRELTESLLPPEVFAYKDVPTIYFVRHHLAHMAASYYTSGFRDAAGLIIDGQGESESISLYKARDKNIKCIKTYDIPFSLGLFYEAAGYFSGLGWGAPGKFMGLSAYGRPCQQVELNLNIHTGEITLPYFIDQKLQILDNKKLSNEITHLWTDYFKAFFYPYEVGHGENIMSYQNFSASIQKKLEDIACKLARVLKTEVDSHNLVMGGGVILNCSMNEAIRKTGHYKNLFVFPAANDAGCSAGAALALYHHLNDNVTQVGMRINNVDWGREFDRHEIELAFRENNLQPDYLQPNNLIQRVADDLTNNLIVAWFQGRDEMGPRALGKRSILANPTNRNNAHKLNKIKGREIWRPIAPSILSEYIEKVFESSIDPILSRFMLTLGRISESYRKLVPAIVHSDFTTRPHVVYQRDDPLYWKLIEAFRQITGIPLLCNTSFNEDNLPIVHTPLDAIKLFLGKENIDTLVIGQYYISRK